MGGDLNIQVRLVEEWFFFFQAEDGIRDLTVTGVQTCALPISSTGAGPAGAASSKGGAIQARPRAHGLLRRAYLPRRQGDEGDLRSPHSGIQIGRASCRERV